MTRATAIHAMVYYGFVVLILAVDCDGLKKEDHHLHAAQQSVAEFSPLTQQFHAVLTCGKFTYLEDTTVTVVWQTPDGSTVPSTEYVQGSSRLLLPNPVTAGVYQCCMSADSEKEQSASVMVDAVLTRLMLLEAENTALTAKMETMNHEMKNENAVLTTKMLTMEDELQFVKNHALHPVAFTATLSSEVQVNMEITVVLPSVLLNQGDAYDNSTGHFTAPVSGVYYFSAFAVAGHDSLYASLRLKTTSKSYLFICYAHREGGHLQTCSLHGVVYLDRGEQAWLVAHFNSYFRPRPDVAFSGFLLSMD